MTTLDDCDRALLDAVDHVGPASAHVLEVHPVSDQFGSFDAMAHRLEELTEAKYLTCRTVVDVAGDPVLEYDIGDG